MILIGFSIVSNLCKFCTSFFFCQLPIITHCAPTSIALMGTRHNEADRLTDFLQEVQERAKYHYWLFGHYHDNRAIDEKHILLWEQIVRII